MLFLILALRFCGVAMSRWPQLSLTAMMIMVLKRCDPQPD